MALRNIREIGDPVLTKRAKEVTEMTDEEIAAATGLKAVSVRVHLSRARKRLAEMLGGKGEDA